jgi:hypothetical protein
MGFVASLPRRDGGACVCAHVQKELTESPRGAVPHSAGEGGGRSHVTALCVTNENNAGGLGTVIFQ